MTTEPIQPAAEDSTHPFDRIVDETIVRSYTLPDLLTAQVTTADQWQTLRRSQVLGAFNESVYGQIPGNLDNITFQAIRKDAGAFDGDATFRIIRITMRRSGREAAFHLNLYTPNNLGEPAPVFVLANNRHETPDPYDPNSDFWPVRKLVAQGFAAAEFDNHELAPDNNEHFREGVMRLYPELDGKANGWRAISAWAFGLMRSVDYLVQDPAIDANRIITIGHSRGGKTALWAAANDPRIAMVCVNNSGCTGAAIARRMVGETVRQINDQFPFWFNDNYKKYNDCEDDLPVDQHMLVALVAPRIVCVGSGLDDVWADPHGEYLALVHASPVYALYGKRGLPPSLPVVVDGQTFGDGMAYHIRAGGHGLKLHDWQRYIAAARRYLKISE